MASLTGRRRGPGACLGQKSVYIPATSAVVGSDGRRTRPFAAAAHGLSALSWRFCGWNSASYTRRQYPDIAAICPSRSPALRPMWGLCARVPAFGSLRRADHRCQEHQARRRVAAHTISAAPADARRGSRMDATVSPGQINAQDTPCGSAAFVAGPPEALLHQSCEGFICLAPGHSGMVLIHALRDHIGPVPHIGKDGIPRDMSARTQICPARDLHRLLRLKASSAEARVCGPDPEARRCPAKPGAQAGSRRPAPFRARLSPPRP